MRRVPARLLGERPSLSLGKGLAPVSLQSSHWFSLRDGRITRFDELLEPIASRDIQGLPKRSQLLDATDELSAVVVVADSTLLWRDGRTVAEIEGCADSAMFLAESRLMLAVPQRDGNAQHHDLVLIDAMSGRILDASPIDVYDAGTFMVATGDGGVVVDAGEGQDGSKVFVASVADDRLSVELLVQNVTVAGFSPSGSRLLLTPHPSFEDVVTLLDWKTRRPVARLSSETAGLTDDQGFDFYGCYAGEDRVLLLTHSSGVLACDGDLDPIGWVDLGGALSGDAEIGSLIGLGPSTFTVEVWRGGEGRTSVWSLD